MEFIYSLKLLSKRAWALLGRPRCLIEAPSNSHVKFFFFTPADGFRRWERRKRDSTKAFRPDGAQRSSSRSDRGATLWKRPSRHQATPFGHPFAAECCLSAAYFKRTSLTECPYKWTRGWPVFCTVIEKKKASGGIKLDVGPNVPLDFCCGGWWSWGDGCPPAMCKDHFLPSLRDAACHRCLFVWVGEHASDSGRQL